MRFIANGPAIPDELLLARDAGDVILFCGAGVSQAEAGLPNFVRLGREVIRILGAAQESRACLLIDLFEGLKKKFPDDDIRRVPKGVAGADITHVLKSAGKDCGMFVYDSKNRKDWKDQYAAKLHTDQIAAGAEHAILSAYKFPPGTHHIAEREGALIVSPALVPTIAEILRQAMIRIAELCIADDERENLTAALYALVMTDQFWQPLVVIEQDIATLRSISATEKTDQADVHKKRDRIIDDLQKRRNEIVASIERIIKKAGEA